MDKEKLYEQLRAKCYKILYPKGIPLEKGVEVAWGYRHSLNSKSKVWRIKRGIFVNWNEWQGHNAIVVFYGNKTTKKLPVENIEVLGKPLSLQDVLRVLKISIQSNQNHSNRTAVYIRYDGAMFYQAGFVSGETGHNEIRLLGIELDLTLSIQDQSEETLQKLLDLI